jgi:AraC-like DNA-binding protein
MTALNKSCKNATTLNRPVQTETAKGVLYPAAFEKMVSFWRINPAEDLRFLIEHYWGVRWDLRGQPSRQQEVLSYPSVHMTFEQGQSRFVGIVSTKFIRTLEGYGWVFGVKFHPGAFHLLSQSSVSAFTDQTVPIQRIFGEESRVLEQGIWSHPDTEAQIKFTEEFLRRQKLKPDPKARLCQEITQCIQEDRELIGVAQVAEQFQLPKRSLQRLFQQYVGVSPKWVIQRFRLHEAAESLSKGEDATQLAYQLGYFDQAHFSKDFKSVVGLSPSAYMARCLTP